jgi:hypothetical protein
MRTATRLAGLVTTSVFALLASPAAADARQQPDQQSPAPVERTADFLFGRPHASVGVRGSWIFAAAGSDLFDFVTRQLTLDKSDFDGPAFAADVAIAVSSRLQIEGGVEAARVQRPSEYREFVDNNLQPIEQTTELATTSLTGGVRYALAPPGREVSRLVWVPSKVVPFVGAGAGAVFYRFRQYGDFVDFVDRSIFYDAFRAAGWTPTAYAYGGVDLQLHRGLYATVQGRYTKAAGELGTDFVNFDPIDLSGFRLSAGINILF